MVRILCRSIVSAQDINATIQLRQQIITQISLIGIIIITSRRDHNSLQRKNNGGRIIILRVNTHSQSIVYHVETACPNVEAAGTKASNIISGIDAAECLANARIIGCKGKEQQVAINIYLRANGLRLSGSRESDSVYRHEKQ